MSAPQSLTFDPCNTIRLIGRVVREPDVTVLPSGDEVIKAKLSVPRPRPPAGKGRRATSDQVVCAAWDAPIRRRVRVWCKDDVVEVEGALRSRVWRRDDGIQILYEVELSAVTMLQTMTTPSRSEDDHGTEAPPDRQQLGV